MSEKHPYVKSNGPLIQVINHLRKSFPATVSAKTLKKLGYAKENESYVINTLRFIGIIDDHSNKTDIAGKIFTLHEDKSFQNAFSDLIKKAYSELFSLHQDSTWSLDQDALITFFRQTDQSSAVTGKRQAHTFKALTGLSGHGEVPEPKPKKIKETTFKTHAKVNKKTTPINGNDRTLISPGQQNNKNQLGLTVRIEINLPAEGNQETYDRIFKSIRENLING